MTKNIVLVTQEENWQDNGGAHDPMTLCVSDADYERLVQIAYKDADNTHDEIGDILDRSTRITQFPVMIDDVLNIWYAY